MDLACGCIDREVIKYGGLQNELLEWRKKCFGSKSFCTPPDTNAMDFSTSWNVLKYKNSSFSDDNEMVISVEIKDCNKIKLYLYVQI
jgi:hypothetical protein